MNILKNTWTKTIGSNNQELKPNFRKFCRTKNTVNLFLKKVVNMYCVHLQRIGKTKQRPARETQKPKVSSVNTQRKNTLNMKNMVNLVIGVRL